MSMPKPRFLIPLLVLACLTIAAVVYRLWPDPVPPARIEVPSGEMERHPITPTAAPPIANLPEPAIGAMLLPAKDTISYPSSVGGEVLFVRDGNLYAARFDEKVATRLDTGVIPTSLHLSPDQHTLLYQKQDTTRNYFQLFSLNVTTHAIVKLDEHPDAFLDFEFSPDGMWVAYIQTAFPDLLMGMRDLYARRESAWRHTDQQLVVRRVDGKLAHVWIDRVYAKAWLADNTLLALYYDPEIDDAYTMRIIPEDGTPDENREDELFINVPSGQTPVERGIILMRARAELRTMLASVDLRLATPTNDTQPGTAAISPTGESYIEIIRDTEMGHCGLVTLMRRGYSVAEVPQQIFQLRRPLDVRDPIWLANDGVLFIVTEAPNCDATRATASLYFVAPYAEAHPIASSLDLTTDAPFAPSHDGRYVLWAGVDAATTQGYIALTDVQTGETSRVIIGTAGQHFGGLVWANPEP